MRANIERCSKALTNLFNDTTLTSNFSYKFKVADVNSIVKKGEPQKSKSYRPASVLHVGSKVFASLLNKQMGLHVEEYLS